MNKIERTFEKTFIIKNDCDLEIYDGDDAERAIRHAKFLNQQNNRIYTVWDMQKNEEIFRT